MTSQILFFFALTGAVFLFSRNIRRIVSNIRMGRPVNRYDQPYKRWLTVLRVAFAQQKMTKKPIAFLLHLFVYLGFVIINIEMLEIVIDGLTGTHRLFSVAGPFYSFLISSFEFLALAVIIACAIFLIRRNILQLKRFSGIEMRVWPKTDADIILISEILLMLAFLFMNAADYKIQILGASEQVASFPVSQHMAVWLPVEINSLHLIERFCWWFHILGVLAFLNYLPYSKHLHILFAFPNTYYSNLESKGKFENMAAVTNEVRAMLDPSLSPPVSDSSLRFGANDVEDLSWKNLLDAYTCTECGRCTAACPANLTGKLLSPRKIMMDTRDRLTEAGAEKRRNTEEKAKKKLLDDYITREEIWACTTCNACVEACPVNINPMEIILKLRQYAVMEEAQAPAALNSIFSNIENNGAPWKYAATDRENWAKD